MRKLFILFSFLFSIIIYSQQYREFYVVQKSGHSIEPTSKTVGTNSQLTLTFEKLELQNFFQSKVIFNYKKAFPESENDTLKNTYFVRSNLNLDKNNIAQLSDVLFVEELELLDDFLLHEPNDYFFEIGSVKNQSILDLVRAPLAWEITTKYYYRNC